MSEILYTFISGKNIFRGFPGIYFWFRISFTSNYITLLISRFKTEKNISLEFWSCSCELPRFPMFILNICCIFMFFISRHIKVKCIRKCSLSQPTRVLRYFCSTCTILGNEGVVARTWKYDSLSRLPPGQFVTRFADFFRVLSRGKRGGKREMEIEKLEKGDSSWSTARYALSARSILPSLPRQSLFMLRHYLKRCTLSCNLPDEIPSLFNVQV